MAASVATIVTMMLVALAVVLFLVWFLLPYASSRACGQCGARRPWKEEACGVCGAPMHGWAEAHPGALPYGFPRPATPADEQEPRSRVEDGVAYNRGITKRVVTLATAAMFLGIGLRVVGMLGVVGLPQVPHQVDAALTIAGGLVAFVGFVFLDAA